jgi:UDPglucose 6-dehydrogenase
MKTGSDNCRDSAMAGVIYRLQDRGIELFIYEPSLDQDTFNDTKLIKDLNKFISQSDVIIANRMDEVLLPHKAKVYCRDIFGKQ